MEDFVRKTKGVRDINSLPLSANHELDMVADVKGKIYIKILNRYKELLFDNGTEQWVTDMLNNLEVDVEQLKEDILDIEQSLSNLPMMEDKLNNVETKLTQINALFTQLQTDVNGLDLRTAELEREVIQLALKDQELLEKINSLDVDLNFLYSNSVDFGDYDYSGNQNLLPNLDFSKLSRSNNSLLPPPPYVKDHGTYFEVDMSDPSALGNVRNIFIPFITRLQKGKTYTISANIMISDEMNIAKCPMYYSVYRSLPTPETLRPVVLFPTNDNKNKFVRVSKTFTTPSDMFDGDFAPFLQWYFPSDAIGKYYVGYDIKIEEGSTATPYQPNLLDAPYYLSDVALSENVPYYKYVGINLSESKNPNDYNWIPLAKAAETVDARLTKTITTYDTVNALQNNRLTTLESKVVDTAWTNVTPISPFTTVHQIQVKRQNGIVYMRGILSDGVGDCFTLPEGFRPPNDEYEYHYLLPGRSTVQTDAAKIYVRPNGLCSIVSKTGTTPIFLEPIQFSIT